MNQGKQGKHLSIVEKALSKLQADKTSKAAIGNPVERLRTAAVAPPPRLHAADLPQPAGPSRDTSDRYRNRINVNIEALREQGMIPQIEQVTRVRDELRRIKWPLLEAALGRGGERLTFGNLIEITSSLPNEGKTFVSLGLALSIALEHDCTVLLVDADVTKQHLTQLFGLADRPGLLELIGDESAVATDLIAATNIEGLRILPAGRRNPRAPELIASKRTESVFAALSSEFDDRVVLFDTAPVLATNEAQLLAKLVGQVLLVVRAEHTPQNVVKDALSLLEGSRTISCVLNQVHRGQSTEYYAGQYGYHSPAE